MVSLMDSMSVVDGAEDWAAQHIVLLQALLQGSEADCGLLPSDVTAAHVVGLVNILSSKHGSPWEQHFSQAHCSRATAFTIWLGRLGGYSSALLSSITHADCKSNYRTIERKISGYKARRNELKSQLAKLKLKGHADAHKVEQTLIALNEDMLQPFDWRLLQSLNAAPPPPIITPPPQAVQRSDEEKTRARDVRWLVACGASYQCSPFHALAGHTELLAHISNLACPGGMALWAPVARALPQVETLRALYLEHAKVVMLQQLVDERDARISELQVEAERTSRREAHVLQLEAKARSATQRVRAEEEERFQIYKLLEKKSGFNTTGSGPEMRLQLQSLMFDKFGSGANDLADGDSGVEGRAVRQRKVKKRKGKNIVSLHGWEWDATEEFEIDRLIGKMVAEEGVEVPGRTNVHQPGTTLYKVLWAGFPPDTATWEAEDDIPCGVVDFVSNYEAGLNDEGTEEEEDGIDV